MYESFFRRNFVANETKEPKFLAIYSSKRMNRTKKLFCVRTSPKKRILPLKMTVRLFMLDE